MIEHCDMVISNPPYISPDAFNHSTTRSVRNYEPKLALVPERSNRELLENDMGDVFYPRLLEIAKELEAKIVMFEVADLGQAQRVAQMAIQQGIWSTVEIWRDQPSEDGEPGDESGLPGVAIRGLGHGRSVFAWRGEATQWLRH